MINEKLSPQWLENVYTNHICQENEKNGNCYIKRNMVTQIHTNVPWFRPVRLIASGKAL